MGHTLVARFGPESRRFLHGLMEPFGANKIPFGRNCDREAANREMDYHLTLLHWAKTQDEYYLSRVRDFVSVPCQVRVTGAQILSAEEGSLLLYFSAEPASGFRELVASLEQKTQVPCSGFLHITLAVSKDPREIEAIHRHIRQTATFPFTLDIEGLDLYHIWRPTKLVASL